MSRAQRIPTDNCHSALSLVLARQSDRMDLGQARDLRCRMAARPSCELNARCKRLVEWRQILAPQEGLSLSHAQLHRQHNSSGTTTTSTDNNNNKGQEKERRVFEITSREEVWNLAALAGIHIIYIRLDGIASVILSWRASRSRHLERRIDDETRNREKRIKSDRVACLFASAF